MKNESLNIAIQGLAGSFHHEAAIHLYGENLNICECETFDQVAEQVKKGTVDFGIMAIENSLAGSIIPNYKLLRHSGLEICGEVGIKVHLNLLGLPGTTIEDIREIHSHPMALRQCNTYLKQHQQLQIVEAFDTAGSAKLILENGASNLAAIAGKLAAKTYKMEVLAEGIEDHNMNFTRFLAIRIPNGQHDLDRINKVSVYFETAHEPGSLAKFLTAVSDLNINLSKLQSYPIPSKNTHYGFYATLDIEPRQKLDLEKMLEHGTIYHHILGAYERGETHE